MEEPALVIDHFDDNSYPASVTAINPVPEVGPSQRWYARVLSQLGSEFPIDSGGKLNYACPYLGTNQTDAVVSWQ